MEGLSGGLDAAQTLGAYLSEQWHPYGYSLILLQRQEGSRRDFEAFRTEIMKQTVFLHEFLPF